MTENRECGAVKESRQMRRDERRKGFGWAFNPDCSHTVAQADCCGFHGEENFLIFLNKT